MAASVDNRQFRRLEPALNRIIRPLKPGPTLNHRQESTGRSRTNTRSVFVDRDDDCSSSEDEENENHYEELVAKSKYDLEPSILDPRDEGTSDNWIKRNSTMVRLTGKHPFNSEPPLNRLMHHGFITPVPLHYVRNHGAVPKGSWDEWTVEVTGLVKRPTVFTMDQLVSEFPSRELPVTLV
ncbi:hypothetical protein SLE2022_053390 [Rubroshorea leprosula]